MRFWLAALLTRREATSDTAEVQKRATAAISRVDDLFLRQILALIAAAAPEKTASQIAAEVPADKAREIAAERISSEMFTVFSDDL